MRRVVAAVESYADGDAPVLICGEHGTGRELVARVLHQKGPRTGARFIAVRPSFEDAPSAGDTKSATGEGNAAGEGNAPREGNDCERAPPALPAPTGGTLPVKDVSDPSP